MVILVDEGIPDAGTLFGGLGRLRFYAGGPPTAAALAGADALVVRSVTRVGAPLLAGTSVRFVGTASSGVDHVDCQWLRSQGIHFASAAGCNARTVAEYVLTAVLFVAARKGISLEGQTLGVIGVGRIGSIVSTWAEALGMTVLRCDPPRESAGERGPWTTLSELLRGSDWVTLHTPLTTAGPYPTINLIDRVRLEQMKSGAILINTARGEVVAEEALLQALGSGRIGGAVLDVWRGEPAVSAQLVERCDLATPHVAGYSRQAKRRAARMIAERLAEWSGLPTLANPTAAEAPPECNAAIAGKTPGPSTSDDASQAPSPLQAIESLSEEAGLLGCLLHACDILTMDRRFKEAVRDARSAGRFETLRATWLDREEFSAHRVRTGGRGERVAQMLRVVGFHVE